MTLTLGGIPCPHRVLAAPMCGASKLPYRRLARAWGADLTFTEMVKSTPLAAGEAKTLEFLETAPDEAPVGPQVCGRDLAELAEAARRLEGLGFPLVDLNMGCPVRKVVRSGAGAALLKDPGAVEAVTEAVARAVTVPVSVKLRSGWSREGDATPEDLARAVERGGARWVTIHARTRDQRHQGAVDEDALRRAKAAVSIPVVANGGITTGEEAAGLLRRTGCDAVMIGRGAHGQPWLFRDAARAIAGLPPLPPPARAERVAIARAHLDGLVALLGYRGLLSFRKASGWYLLADEGGEDLRKRAIRAQTPEAMHAILDQWEAGAAVGAPS